MTLPNLNKNVYKDENPPEYDFEFSPIIIQTGTKLITTKTTNETIDNVNALIDYISGDNSTDKIPQSAIDNLTGDLAGLASDMMSRELLLNKVTIIGDVSATNDNYPSELAVRNELDTKEDSLGYTPENITNKGMANGYPALDSSGSLLLENFPSGSVGDVLSINGTGDGLEFVSLADVQGITSINGDVTAAQIIEGVADKISIDNTTSGITIIDIDPNYIGQNTITTLGLIGTGQWGATQIDGVFIDAEVTDLSDGLQVVKTDQTNIYDNFTQDFSLALLQIQISNAASMSIIGHLEINNNSDIELSYGILKYYDGTDQLGVISIPIDDFTGMTDGYVVAFNSTSNLFELVAQAGAASGDMLLGSVQVVTAEKTFNTGTLALGGSTSGKTTLNGPVDGTGKIATLQDITGVIALLVDITTPTIDDFTNAIHNHENDNGGGILSAISISDFSTAVDAAIIANSAVAANTAKVTNAAHTGDVTGTVDLTIAPDAVTYAKMQNISSDNVLLGNIAGANGIVTELTGAQVNTLLPNFTNTLDGLVPLSGGGATFFLNAEGDWAVPVGGGGTSFVGFTADDDLDMNGFIIINSPLIQLDSGSVFEIDINATPKFSVSETEVNFHNNDIRLAFGSKLYLNDNDDNTYIINSGNDDVSWFVGGKQAIRLSEKTNGVNIIFGSESSLPTTAIDGFLYISSMPGAPTGNPSDFTGKFPIVWDSSNENLYINTGGTTWFNINAGGSGGEVNTASNSGSGEGLVLIKDAFDLPFKSLIGEANRIILTGNVEDITFTIGTDIVTLTDAQTLTDKTFTTPVIDNFTNAIHNHEDDNGGGILSAISISDFSTAVDAAIIANSAVAANTAKVTNAAHTGDVTGTVDLTIADDAVTFAKMQNISSNILLGSIGSAAIVELTGIQVNSLLPDFTEFLDGLVPRSGGGTDNFLRADGSWVIPLTTFVSFNADADLEMDIHAINIGTNYAELNGVINLENNTSIEWRNAADTGNRGIKFDGNDNFTFTGSNEKFGSLIFTNHPTGLTIDPANDTLLIRDAGTGDIYQVTPNDLGIGSGGGGEVFAWSADHSMETFKLTAADGNDLFLNAPTGQVARIEVGGVIEYIFTGAHLDLNGNSLRNAEFFESNAASVPESGVIRLGNDEKIAFKDSTGTLDLNAFYVDTSNNTVINALDTGLIDFQINEIRVGSLSQSVFNLESGVKFQEDGVNISPIGIHDIGLPASAFFLPTFEPATELVNVNFPINNIDKKVFGMPTSVNSRIQTTIYLPRNWDAGTFDIEVYFSTASSNSGTVRWTAKVATHTPGAAIDQQFAASTISDYAFGGVDESLTTTISNIPMPAGTQSHHEIQIEIYREGTHVNDNFPDEIRFHGASLHITTNAAVAV